MDLDQIRHKHNLKLVILHGSQLTGKTHAKSDLDLAVVRTDENEFDLLSLILDLKIYFKNEKIDLTDITHADPLLLFSVIQKSKLLSGDIMNFKSLEELAFFKYSDYKAFLQIRSGNIQYPESLYIQS